MKLHLLKSNKKILNSKFLVVLLSTSLLSSLIAPIPVAYGAGAAPIITTPTVSVASNGTGYATITSSVMDAADSSVSLKVEYSDDDGVTWYDPDLVSAAAQTGSEVVTNANEYQVALSDQFGSSLVGYWKLDESSGTLADATGNGYTGTSSGSPTYASAGHFSNAMTFDGTNDYVGIGYNAALAPTSQITVSTWGYMDNWTTMNADWLIGKTQGGGYNISGGSVSLPGDGYIGFTVGTNNGGANAYVTAKTALSGLSTGWHHFVGTYDGRYATFYVDGVSAGTGDATTNRSIYYSANNSLIFGADAGSTTTPDASTYWAGRLDDVAVFNTAITSGQVSEMYSGSILGTSTIVWDTFSASNGNGAITASQSDIKVRVTPYDGSTAGTAGTSAAFMVDNEDPSGLANFGGSFTGNDIDLTWTAVTETNFDHYEVWYGTSQSDVQNRTGTATEWDNSDDATLATVTTATTAITGLSTGAYYFKIGRLMILEMKQQLPIY